MLFRSALISLAVAQPFLAVPAHAGTPALWSFNEQTVMMLPDDPALRMQAGLAACLGTPEGPGTAADRVARHIGQTCLNMAGPAPSEPAAIVANFAESPIGSANSRPET